MSGHRCGDRRGDRPRGLLPAGGSGRRGPRRSPTLRAAVAAEPGGPDQRGQRRGKDGKFRKPPTILAKAVHDELVKRRMSRAYDLLRESTYDAVKVLVEVATDKKADTAVRVKAAGLILDRTLGKAPQHVSLDFQGDVPWKQMMAQAVVGSVEQARALLEEEDVVDGEVVEETG